MTKARNQVERLTLNSSGSQKDPVLNQPVNPLNPRKRSLLRSPPRSQLRSQRIRALQKALSKQTVRKKTVILEQSQAREFFSNHHPVELSEVRTLPRPLQRRQEPVETHLHCSSRYLEARSVVNNCLKRKEKIRRQSNRKRRKLEFNSSRPLEVRSAVKIYSR